MEDSSKFKYLEHTADAKFEAYGANMEEAFMNAALATFNIITKTENVKPAIEKEISVNAKRDTSLLYDFIEELLFLLDTEGFILSEVKDLKIIKVEDSFDLKATITGDDYKNYPGEVHGNIKSITYNDMSIIERGDGWTLTVVVDL